MSVQYEWDVELVTDDEHQDIVEHAHQASYKECIEWIDRNPCPGDHFYEIVLVRDDDNGRSWAYVQDGRLPYAFSDADGHTVAKVPQRFHKETS